VLTGRATARDIRLWAVRQPLGPEEVAALDERRLRRLVIAAAIILAVIAICVFSFTVFADSVRNGIF
jgi:hypothetical protein